MKVNKQLTFIVTRTTSMEAVPADNGLERRREPQAKLTCWLDIVVAINKNGRRIHSALPLSSDDRMSRRLVQRYFVKASVEQPRRQPIRRRSDVPAACRLGTYRGKTH